MAPAILPIQSARLIKTEPCQHFDSFFVEKLFFDVPLRHDQPDGERLVLVAQMVHGEASFDTMDASHRRQLTDSSAWLRPRDRPILLYLCGGPGADNPPCRVPDMNRWLLRRGYQILYVDYRGCGESSPVRSKALAERGMSDQGMADYIKQFCQDNIVRDLEAIRLCLSAQVEKVDGADVPLIKWTILGQSYGGYISLTYLSIHPNGLLEVFITGGLPPCGMDIEDYFNVEYVNIVAQNKLFYAAYPDADKLLRDVLKLITRIGPGNIPMSGRGYMTGQKLLTLGRQFGSKVGFPEVYHLLQKIYSDLAATRKLSPDTVREFESILHIDERPLYPVLLEQTWCSGGPTRWAAERVAVKLEGFEYLKADSQGKYPDPSETPAERPIYFNANTYCRFHYDTHEELIDMKGAVEILAEHPWECSYDFEQLAENPLQVPVYAMSFLQDMHLDLGVSGQTAAKVGGLRLIEDPGWHQDIRYKPATVLERLFRVRDGVNEGAEKPSTSFEASTDMEEGKFDKTFNESDGDYSTDPRMRDASIATVTEKAEDTKMNDTQGTVVQTTASTGPTTEHQSASAATSLSAHNVGSVDQHQPSPIEGYEADNEGDNDGDDGLEADLDEDSVQASSSGVFLTTSAMDNETLKDQLNMRNPWRTLAQLRKLEKHAGSCSHPQFRLDLLPAELLPGVAEHLPIESAACLALVCKATYSALESSSFQMPKPDRSNFLLLIEQQRQSSFACCLCLMLHSSMRLHVTLDKTRKRYDPRHVQSTLMPKPITSGLVKLIARKYLEDPGIFQEYLSWATMPAKKTTRYMKLSTHVITRMVNGNLLLRTETYIHPFHNGKLAERSLMELEYLLRLGTYGFSHKFPVLCAHQKWKSHHRKNACAEEWCGDVLCMPYEKSSHLTPS
ncbi:hypothetical protein diail_7916 [Diaporthe ilicicola]|nr:hypothetical protein diail_7916 [Diaporthe ilicicola]